MSAVWAQCVTVPGSRVSNGAMVAVAWASPQCAPVEGSRPGRRRGPGCKAARREERCVGQSLRVSEGAGVAAPVTQQRWPLRVTATDKQVSVPHGPSPSALPGAVTHGASLLAHPSTPSLLPASQGRRARAAALAPAPGGEPGDGGDKCHLLRPRE